ncbi:MAG: CBS domain-containing protein [Betaproteobacteria bacterium]|nr:MAG: CBS domain-containing protein [Betaproteobacteria bacterium]
MPSSATESTAGAADAALPMPLGSLMRAHVHTCPPSAPVRTALETMRNMSIGSIVVRDAGGQPVGILTLRDVLDRVALESGVLDAPISQVMTAQPACLRATDSAYDAAMLMVRRGVRHVVVVDASGLLAGVVSERDLFGMQTTGVRHLSTVIKNASDLPAVEAFGREIQAIARQMLLQGAAIAPLTAFVSSLIDLLTERIVQLEMQAADPNLKICWIVMGSEGRSEQTLVTDQDNGIVFQRPPDRSPDEVREALLPIARRINEALARAGYSLCAGNIMASNPKWCLTPDEWRDRFRDWIDSGSPEALLHGSIFFDLRPLTGALELAHDLRAWVVQHASRNRRFLHQMAANALRNRPALGLLHRFAKSEDGTLDLKMSAATPFIDAARIMSLGAALDEVRTEARLRGSAGLLNVPVREVEAWVGAFYQIQGYRLQCQARSIAAGLPPSNRVDPEQLNDFDQQVLKLALEQARLLQRRLALDYEL